MPTNFDWFLAFWGWAEERFRRRVTASTPLAEVALNWSMWWREIADAKTHSTVDKLCADTASRQEFVDWVTSVWRAKNTPDSDGNRVLLHQLASIEPFSSWTELSAFAAGFGSVSTRAVVVPRTPGGPSAKVIALQGVAIPGGGPVIGVGNQLRLNSGSAMHVLAAARGVLHGRGIFSLLFGWAVAARRPYPKVWAFATPILWAVGFVSVVATLFLSGDGATLDVLILAAVWTVIPMAIINATVALSCLGSGWLAARRMHMTLGRNQIVMTSDKTVDVEGTSADLPASLAVLCALRDVCGSRRGVGCLLSYPGPEGAWVWKNIFRGLRDQSWASIGSIEDGMISHVEDVDKKLAACCSAEPAIFHVAIPRDVPRESYPCENGRDIYLHRFASFSGFLLFRGGLQQPWRLWYRFAAISVLALLLLNTDHLSCLILPPEAPRLTPGHAASEVWLSEEAGQIFVRSDSARPGCFCVVLKSSSWRLDPSNPVPLIPTADGGGAADLHLRRSSQADPSDVWVTIRRRRRFLGREFAPGVEVARFPLDYIKKLSSRVQ